jgi:hypothetical protein
MAMQWRAEALGPDKLDNAHGAGGTAADLDRCEVIQKVKVLTFMSREH